MLNAKMVLEALVADERNDDPAIQWVRNRFEELAAGGSEFLMIAIGFFCRFWEGPRKGAKDRIRGILDGTRTTMAVRAKIMIEDHLSELVPALESHAMLEVDSLEEVVSEFGSRADAGEDRKSLVAAARHIMRARDDLESSVLVLNLAGRDTAALEKKLAHLDSLVVEYYRLFGALGAWDYESLWMWAVSFEHWWSPPLPTPLCYTDPAVVMDAVADAVAAEGNP